MFALEISERRELEGADYGRVARHRDSSQRGLSGRVQFIGDIQNQTSHGRELAAGILQQAMAGLWRFRKSKDKAGREVYSDAVSWFLSNETQWPCSLLMTRQLVEAYELVIRTQSGLEHSAVVIVGERDQH